jgi:hypothetical protein
MKHRKLFAVGVLALAMAAGTPLASAQSTPEIDKALSALPEGLRADATVIKWKSDFSYDTLKQGKSKLVCYDRSGQPLQQPFSIECTNVGNLPRVAQNMKIESTAGDRDKANAAVAAAEKDGTRVKAEFGSVFFNFMGASEDKARRHTTISVPNATAASMGLPDTRDAGGAWIMGGGTGGAHIMLPGF